MNGTWSTDGSSDVLTHPQHAYDWETPSGQRHLEWKVQSKAQHPYEWVPLSHWHW